MKSVAVLLMISILISATSCWSSTAAISIKRRPGGVVTWSDKSAVVVDDEPSYVDAYVDGLSESDVGLADDLPQVFNDLLDSDAFDFRRVSLQFDRQLTVQRFGFSELNSTPTAETFHCRRPNCFIAISSC